MIRRELSPVRREAGGYALSLPLNTQFAVFTTAAFYILRMPGAVAIGPV